MAPPHEDAPSSPPPWARSPCYSPCGPRPYEKNTIVDRTLLSEVLTHLGFPCPPPATDLNMLLSLFIQTMSLCKIDRDNIQKHEKLDQTWDECINDAKNRLDAQPFMHPFLKVNYMLAATVDKHITYRERTHGATELITRFSGTLRAFYEDSDSQHLFIIVDREKEDKGRIIQKINVADLCGEPELLQFEVKREEI